MISKKSAPDHEVLNDFLRNSRMCDFEIGDVVGLRVQMESWLIDHEINPPQARENWRGGHKLVAPSAMIITSRWIEQCYGGTQIHYGVRAFKTTSGEQVVSKLAPFELVLYSEIADLQKERKEDIDEATDKAEAERAEGMKRK